MISVKQPPELLMLVYIGWLILFLRLRQVLQAVGTHGALSTEIHSDGALEQVLILCRLLI